jgi:Fe2+ or Zn2+ uptake regulation protein
MKVKRFTKNRIDVLKAVYESTDWVMAKELLHLGVDLRTVQANLTILFKLGMIHREEVYPAYRYKIDKSKDLQYYFDYLDVFRMKKTMETTEK